MNSNRASSLVRTASVTTSGTVDAIELDLKYTRSDLPSFRWALSFAKSSAIIVLLLCSLAVASIWTTSGTRFIYDSGSAQSPLIKCPSLWNYDVFNQAPFCKFTINIVALDVYNQLTASGLTAPTEAEAQSKGLCLVPAIDPEDIKGPEAFENALRATESDILCFSKQACGQATNWRTLNPYSYSSLQDHEGFPKCDFTIKSNKISTLCSNILSADAYCDSSFTVSPSTVVSIRGALIGIALLWILLISHDLYQFIILSNHNSAILKFRKSFFVKYICQERFELYNMCLQIWNSMNGALISRNLTNFSVASSPLCRTPSSLSSSVSALNQFAMPHQPVLTPRKSVVSDFKNSPRGYTPRLDSPPVAVVSSISEASKKLSRFNGSVDIMFKTVWKKRIARYYKSHIRNLKSIKLRRFVLRSIAIALISIAVFILLIRLVFAIETGPFVTRMPEGVSLLGNLGLPSIDKLYGIAGTIWADLRRSNPTQKFYLVMWADFLIYLDIIYESAILLVFSFFAIGIPTNQNKRDSALDTKPNDRPPSARLTNKIEENFFMDDTRIPQSNDSVSSSPVSNFSSPVHMIQPKIHNPSNTNLAVPKLIGSPFRNSDRQANSPMHESSSPYNTDPLLSQSIMCVMMSVSSPCATLASRNDFVMKLNSLRKLVESDIDIFVVDCGSTREPIDDTEYVIKTEISDQINYIYYPECNRVLSLYWTSKYWIPFLFSSNLCGDYIYTLFVDEQVVFDNEEFQLPSAEFLMNNPRIKTMYVPVKESPKIFSSDFMGRWREKIELCSIHAACGHSTTHSGNIGVPQIWERNTFEMTCFNLVDSVGTKMLSVLEMKENGKRLLKNRGSSKMGIWISGNGHSQPRNTGAKKFMGFRKINNVFSNMHEFIDPSSFLHWPSVLSKFIIIGEISNVFFDSIRIFLIPGLVLKDPIGFAIATVLVGIMATIPFLVNILINIRFEDHRAAKALYAFFVLPFQLIFKEIPKRTVAFFKGYVRDVVFTKYESDLTIGEREEQFRDLPIVPPHPNPHWSTVWM